VGTFSDSKFFRNPCATYPVMQQQIMGKSDYSYLGLKGRARTDESLEVGASVAVRRRLVRENHLVTVRGSVPLQFGSDVLNSGWGGV